MYFLRFNLNAKVLFVSLSIFKAFSLVILDLNL